jgi:hypothetical protein
MKKFIVLILSLVFTFSCSKKLAVPQEDVPANARGNLDGFLDIAWGESIENAAKILDEKDYIYIAKGDTVTALGEFAGQEAELVLSFFEGRFYSGTISFPAKKSESDYDEYVSIVTEKYGKPSNVSTNIFPMTTWDFNNNCDIDVFFLVKKVRISYTEKELRDRHREQEDEQKEQERQAIKDGL